MGKNRTIKSLGKNIGNIVTHKITLKFGNKPLSNNHTSSEIETYRDNAMIIAQEFNWNDSDKTKIKLETMKVFKKKMKEKYSHIKFPMEEATKTMDETIKECLSD